MADGDRNDDHTVTSADAARARERRAQRDWRSRLGTLASFWEISDRLLHEIEAATIERSFAAGEALIRQGDPGDCLMFIQEGGVEISVTTGRERHVLKRAGSGEVLGEMALLTHQPRTADVVALTPVRALVLPVDEFHRLARDNPSLAEVLSRLTAYRLGRRSHDALSGKVFQGYTIRRRLGRGGMAVVYEAVETASGRRVALKMMSHRLVFDDEARRRFRQEADLIQSFDHPNIAKMFGRFEAFHTYFIVMEYCDGRSLDRILARRGPLPADEVRKVVGQLASALAYAHRRRVVHRDLKPSNVIVTREGIVKLMDFGLARSLAGAESAEGGTAGTPPYMAPEQLAGRPFGTSADLYALAGLTWELLAGERLFAGKDIDGLKRDHEAWSVPDPATAFPDAGDALHRFLSGCLVREPERRAADLDALATWAAPVTWVDTAEDEGTNG